MRYIKKIDSLPLVDGGKVVDSLVTTDNPHTNAPSISVFENRTDGNIIFNSNFSSDLGWTFTPSQGAATGKFVVVPQRGGRFDPGCDGTLDSPSLLPSETGSDIPHRNPGIDNERYSLSIQYVILSSTTQSEYYNTDKSIVKLENFHMSSVGPQDSSFNPVMINEDGILVQFMLLANTLRLKMYNSGSKYLYILNVRLERGSKCTPICYESKDVAIANAIGQRIKTYSENYIGMKWFRDGGSYKVNLSGDLNLVGEWIKTKIDSTTVDRWIAAKVSPTDSTGYFGTSSFTLMANCSSVNSGIAYFMCDNPDKASMVIGQLINGVWTFGNVSVSKAMTWGSSSYTLAAGRHQEIKGVVEMAGYTDGYKAQGILYVNTIVSSGDFVVVGRSRIFDEDGVRKALVDFYNPTASPVTFSVQWRIFYLKG